MAAKEASFDVVSEVNMEEVKNAIQIALKELKNRFDFKGSIADIKLENDKLVVVAEDDYKVEQVKDILFGKLVKRNVPIKNIHFSELGKSLKDYSVENNNIGNAKRVAEIKSKVESGTYNIDARLTARSMLNAMKESKE